GNARRRWRLNSRPALSVVPPTMRWLALIWLVAGAALSPVWAADGLTLHVATNGNDRWSGKLSVPAGNLQDGPVATLAAGLSKARSRPAGAPATLVVHGGIYRLDAPIVFTPADSGADRQS